jgi:hypothetical protein
MEQISPDIIERSVQSVGKWLAGGSFNIELNVIGNLRCLFVFLRPIKIFTIKIKLNFRSKICHFLKKIVM